ncbi:hypothetical protein U5A82_19540 [Sphingobium sp. CR2-8]|uniref:hypothetical protein n=1 Tax=Sphingobium sp. CR2-8 TaxID=1306534 RepID=UPI002DB8265B|nr:hypothetical protein [Sphingobium sp. CR2-8]MEC3912587.1 hypothetical protein [Sphingobium sp. CR2-8]
MRARAFLLSPILVSLAACGSPSPANSQADAVQKSSNVATTAPTARRDSATVDLVASGIDFAALAGRWTVAGVAVGENGVQALAKDDPAYMGQMLEIASDHLAWSPGQSASAANLSDRCDDPVTARQTGAAAQDYDRQFANQLAALGIHAPQPHAVECDSGQWGPEAAGGAILFPAPGGRIAMSWYDGAMLLLERKGKLALH